MPSCISPMLARIGNESDLEREGYLFEPKLDGIRAVCVRDGGRLRFFNRSCVDITAKYPEFDFVDAIADDQVVLDGEIVLYDSAGLPDFTGLMQRHLRARLRGSASDATLRYAVFDVMRVAGDDVTERPLAERKQLLDDLIRRSAHVEKTLYTTDGPALWRVVVEKGLEGVIAKKADGRYEEGRRSSGWIKIKTFDTVDCVIVGFTSDKRSLSALGVALYDADDRLQFIGKVGTGFSDQDVRRLRKLLDPLATDEPQAQGIPRSYRDLRYVEPNVVCTVRYLEIGSQGMMRNPSFLTLRDDKKPIECRTDQIPSLAKAESTS